jgi:hypothetical protein
VANHVHFSNCNLQLNISFIIPVLEVDLDTSFFDLLYSQVKTRW